MGKYIDWREDSEAMTIAVDLAKTSAALARLDLRKVCFIRTNTDGERVCNVHRNKFPYNINSDIAFFVQVCDGKWGALSKDERTECVKDALLLIAADGMATDIAVRGA